MDIAQVKDLIASLPSLPHVEYFKALAKIKKFMAGVVVGDSDAKKYADVVVKNKEGQFLLIQRASNDDFMPNKWWVPGGKIENGETSKDAASRELQEETGIKISSESLTFLEKKSLDNGGVSYRYTGLMKNESIIRLDPDEMQKYKFVTLDELNEYDLLGEKSDLEHLFSQASLVQQDDDNQTPNNSTPRKKLPIVASWDSEQADKDYQKLLAENNQDFVKSAQLYMQKYLQTKQYPTNIGLVRINAESVGETFNGGSRKFREKMGLVVPRIPEMLMTGHITKDELTKVRNDEIKYFYVFSKSLEFDNLTLEASVKVAPREWFNSVHYVNAKEKAQHDGISQGTSHKEQQRNLHQLGFENIKASFGENVNMFDDMGVMANSDTLYEVDINSLEITKVINKETGEQVYESDNLAKSAIFNRQGIKPTNRNGNVDVRARQKANDEAIALLDKIESEGLTRDDLSQEQLETLAKYTGNGGGVVNHEGKKGSQYEYYTPMELASSMWDLAKELGFNGGKVLDPSAGTGVFAATSPENAVMDNVELDRVSGGIAKVLNDGSRSHTVISPFEKEANRIDDNSLDMVMTNVPFGDNKSRGANKTHDKAYQDESLENYFILRSLEKLKYGGLAVFITPTAIVSGKKQANIKLRQKVSLKAEFLGAYRLPNQMFDETGADVVTDVIAFRKYSEEAATTIKDLYDGGNLDTLTQANVLFDDFINGKYFLTEGKRFVLGEVQEVTNKFGGLTEKVFTTKTNPEIAKMLKKFGDSRINWNLLNTTEPNFIEYKNGDVVFNNGKQLTYQDGAWQETEQEVTDTDREMQNLLAKMDNAYTVAVNGVTWKGVLSVLQYCSDTGQRGLIPASLEDLIAKARKSNNPDVAWKCLTIAKAIDDTFYRAGYGLDLREQEPELTQEMKAAFLDGKNSALTGDAKQAHKLISLHYSKGEYSSAWRGEIDNNIEDKAVSYQDKIAQMQYQNKSLYVTREQFDSIYPDIDPLKNDDWFVKANGDVIHANDFLVGKLSDRLADIDQQISKTTDETIKAKLIKQKMIARDSIVKTDVRNIDYSLRSPLIDAETKVKFLQSLSDIGNAAKVVIDENGRPIADIDIKVPKYDREKLLNRMGDWLAKGTVTLGGVKLSMTDKEALEWLSDRINTANVEFETWLKANDKLMVNRPEFIGDKFI